MEYIRLSQNRNQWEVLLNMVMNLLQGVTWLTEQLLASEEGVRSLELKLQLGEVTVSEDIDLIILLRFWFMLDQFLKCFKVYCPLGWDMLLCWVNRWNSRPSITTTYIQYLILLSETWYMFWHFLKPLSSIRIKCIGDISCLNIETLLVKIDWECSITVFFKQC